MKGARVQPLCSSQASLILVRVVRKSFTRQLAEVRHEKLAESFGSNVCAIHAQAVVPTDLTAESYLAHLLPLQKGTELSTLVNHTTLNESYPRKELWIYH